MTNRFKVGLFIAIAAAGTAFAAAGCSVGSATREDILTSYTGACVTYYGNGGFFNDSTTIKVREIYYEAEGVPFYDILEKGNETQQFVDNTGYDLIGWYKVSTYTDGAHQGEEMFTYGGEAVYKVKATNGDGSVKKDKNGNILYVVDDNNRPMYATESNMGNSLGYVPESEIVPVLSDVKLTEADLLPKGNVYVGAKWKVRQRIEYVLVSDGTVTLKDGTKAENGTVLDDTHQFGSGENAQPMTRRPAESSDHTWIANYVDEACTIPVTANTYIDRPAEGNAKVYCKYIAGVWTTVSTKSDVASMFNNKNENVKYYILNDIDCDKQTIYFKSNGVSGTIEGNGHTISNLNLTTPRSGNLAVAPNGSVNSLLGEIKAGCYVKNITFKNVTINLNTSANNSVELYGVFSKLEEGAQIINVKVEDLTLKAKPFDRLTNYAEGEKEGNWLFGGETSDEAFLSAHTDVTVTGATISAG